VRKGYVNEHGCFNFMRVTYRVRKSKTIKMGHSGHTARVPSQTAQIELTVLVSGLIGFSGIWLRIRPCEKLQPCSLEIDFRIPGGEGYASERGYDC
jgi:hypothetical protein